MNESLLMQAKEADIAYHLALANDVPAIEQARLLELWCRLYCEATRDQASFAITPLKTLLNQQRPSAAQKVRARTHH